MYRFILNIYLLLFGSKFFYRFNKLVYRLSLHGLGILNYETDKKSGESYFISHELKALGGGVVIDVGANIGHYCSVIKSVNSDFDIYAFEPHPASYKRLALNTQDIGVRIFNLGVGAEEGLLTLYDYASNDGSEHASLHRGVIEEIHKGGVVEHKVRVVALDEFMSKYPINKVTLLKIDTEGHEFEVLKGAREMLKSGKIEMIQLEFNEMNVISRVFFKDIWDFLPNYDFYRMLPDGLVRLESYSPIFCEIFAYQNIVAKLRSQE